MDCVIFWMFFTDFSRIWMDFSVAMLRFCWANAPFEMMALTTGLVRCIHMIGYTYHSHCKININATKKMSIIDDNWWSLIIECCLPASKRYIQCGSICIVMILIFKKNNRSSMITSSNYFQNTKFQKRLSFFLRLERCTPLMRKINSIKYYVRVLCECYNSILVYDTRKFIWIIIWLSHIYCIAIL